MIGNTLPETDYFQVHHGTEINTGKQVTLKMLEKVFTQVFEQEVNALSMLRHRNILTMLDSHRNAVYPKADASTRDVFLIVQEPVIGDLWDFLCYTGCFDERIARTFFQQLIAGVRHCHLNRVAHRNLKPEGLWLDEEFTLKIAHFGMSHTADTNSQDHVMSTICGTHGYMAPEVLAGDSYDESVDLFSAGVILFIMLAGHPPFKSADKRDPYFRCSSMTTMLSSGQSTKNQLIFQIWPKIC